MNVVIKPDAFIMPNKEDFIFTFYYTETIEKTMGVVIQMFYTYMEKLVII